MSIDKLKFQATISGPGYGYVYVMSYPNSDRVKIGHSLNPTARASEIGGTLAPEVPIVDIAFWCSERRHDVERKAHEIEAKNRRNGEWFEISIDQAIQSIKKSAEITDVEVQLVFDLHSRQASLEKEAKLKQNEIDKHICCACKAPVYPNMTRCSKCFALI